MVEKLEAHKPWNAVEFLGLQVRYLERVALRTPYPMVAERLRRLVRTPPLRGNCVLVVDATGVGVPVIDLLRRSELGCELAAVTITGSGKAAQSGNEWTVPKTDLWAGLTVMLERGELEIAKDMEGVGALARELESLQMATGSARAGEHDDLAMAVALAVWRAMRYGFGVRGWGPKVDDYDAVLKYHCRL